MRRALIAAATLLLATCVASAQATNNYIPLYSPSFSGGITDPTNINRGLADLNSLLAGVGPAVAISPSAISPSGTITGADGGTWGASGIAGTTVNSTPVGATTASTGAFTTLSASSTVSGTGFSTYLASPPAIGGTAAAAGKFTSINASGQITSTAGLPTITSGACGATTNGAVVSGSTNQSGNITIGSASTTTCTVNFSTTLAVAPNACLLQPANTAAAAVGTTAAYISAITTGHFVITGALANANYAYFCL